MGCRWSPVRIGPPRPRKASPSVGVVTCLVYEAFFVALMSAATWAASFLRCQGTASFRERMIQLMPAASHTGDESIPCHLGQADAHGERHTEQRQETGQTRRCTGGAHHAQGKDTCHHRTRDLEPAAKQYALNVGSPERRHPHE